MKAQIFRFTNALRDNDIRVSTGEVLDALQGVDRVGLVARDPFRWALRSALIKRAEDLPTFDRLFDLHFTVMDMTRDDLSPPLADAQAREVLEQVLAEANGLISPWLRRLLLEGVPPLAAALPTTGQQVRLEGMRYPTQAAQFAQRIRRAYGMDGWPEETEHLLARLAQEGASAEDLDRLGREIADRIEQFGGMIRDHVRRQADAVPRNPDARALRPDLLEKGFGALTPWEIQSMRAAVRDLAKKIRDEASLRQRRKRRGRFDLKQTLRRSLRYGGVPMEVSLRKRKKSKGRIVALCDVSSSVWNASRFMLHLLYSLQDQFDKVRSFVFVDQPGEITDLFERFEVNEAVDQALHHADIPYNRYTDYGSMFKEFHETFGDAVNRKTTLVVIGDGRNNFFLPGDEYLARIRSRARRVIWLNPEGRSFWRFGDCVMHRYEKHCDEVRECRNLKQLIAFVNDLTL